MNIPAYGLMLAASALLSFALFTLLLPRDKRYAAPLAVGLSVLFGFVLARVAFWLCSSSLYVGQLHDFASIFRVREGGLAMTGALLGAGLGCFLSAKIIRDPQLPPSALFDALSPALALFIACERCHEWVLLQQNYGLDTPRLHFLSVQGIYSPVLNTSRLSSLLALAILLFLLIAKTKKPGEKGLLFMILYGVTQVFLESLRQDLHLLWNFVRAQQLFAFLAAFAAVMILAYPQGKALRALIISLLTAGCITFLEFALDGRVRPPFSFMTANVKLSWYIVFVLVLIGYLYYGLRLLKGFGKGEKKA